MKTKASVCMGFFEVVMVTGAPIFILITWGIDEKLSRVDALWCCLLRQATWATLCIYFRSQFGNSITNSIWTQQEPKHCCQRSDWCCLWPVTANEKQAKFQQWNCPHLCAILYYPWHFNSLLNYFQIRADSWFIQRGTLQRTWSNNKYPRTHKSKTSEGGYTHSAV